MDQRENIGPSTVRRAALGLCVLALHLGLILLIAYTTTVARRHETRPPIVVTFLPQIEPPHEPLRLPAPSLVTVRPIATPPPELELPTDTASAQIISPSPAAQRTQQPPTAGPSQPKAGPNVPEMSEVAYLRPPTPHYPRQSRVAHEEGVVVLRVLIDESGHARDVDVYHSSGHPRLDQEACSAIAHALFKPYIEAGVARPAIAMVPVEFSLRGSSS